MWMPRSSRGCVSLHGGESDRRAAVKAQRTFSYGCSANVLSLHEPAFEDGFAALDFILLGNHT